MLVVVMSWMAVNDLDALVVGSTNAVRRARGCLG
jgi:hypothetical protein